MNAFSSTAHSTAIAQQPIVVQGRRDTGAGKTGLFGEMLDVLNPLHHVPGVSQIYRAATDDKISDGAKFLGHVGVGAAVAGPIGAAAGAGVFLVEKLVSGIGKLFGGAENTGSVKRAAMPGVQSQAPQAAPVQSASAVAGGGQGLPAPRGALPSLSSAQFTALVQSFGQGATQEQSRTAAGLGADSAKKDADFARQMEDNLQKLDSLRKPAVPH
jgi:hypothetical protein